MKFWKLASAATVLVLSTSVNAALVNGATLAFDAGVETCVADTYGDVTCQITSGSYFGMDTNGSNTITGAEKTAISMNNGLILGAVQLPQGSHAGSPDGTETPSIDQPWEWFGNTGMHGTSKAVNILSQTAGSVELDFSGWGFAWNDITYYYNGRLAQGAWTGNPDGVALLECAVDCSIGETYNLLYSATFPAGDCSGCWANVRYTLHLEGTISAVPIPAAVWLFGSGLIGLVGFSRRNKA